MELRKTGIILLALLLSAMAIVPMVCAEDNALVDPGDLEIAGLFEPINAEIESTMAIVVTNDGLAKTSFDSKDFSEQLIMKYQKNLDLILDLLETKTGVKLSVSEREDLKRIIVQEHIEKVSWSEVKKKMGVKDEDFKSMIARQGDSSTQTGNSQLLSLPLSLILVQVSDDVYGGAGLDGAGLPYNVNGDNDLYDVTVDTSYSGKDLYECHFWDEDVPYPDGDTAYDAFRLAYYGTLLDVQGFFIYDPDSSGTRYIEFGNDYDNGNSYATVVGQHGAITLPWTIGTRIYVSNVWNHAMSLTNRNSNMAKITNYYY
ncbi:MAG: hypothetical protein M0Q91_18060 [Methanoregula sp.]|jgi:hypothetical protein|nr:hypothetical protein [Methanoregula sp.]